MSVTALAASLKNKTLPLRWWKALMVCKALAAPSIGAILWWILMELTPTAPINLGNRVDQITMIIVCLVATGFTALSAGLWQHRLSDRVMWVLSYLISAATGALASGVVFTFVHAYSYAY